MCMLYGAVRDCDIQFEASYGWDISRSLLGSTVSSLLFIHPLSLTLLLTPSLADMCSEPVYCDRSACPSPQRLPLLPPRLGACQASGLTAGTYTHSRFNTGTHISSYTFTRTALVCLVWLWNITSHLHCFISDTCLNVILFPQKKGVNYNTDTAPGAQTGTSLFVRFKILVCSKGLFTQRMITILASTPAHNKILFIVSTYWSCFLSL